MLGGTTTRENEFARAEMGFHPIAWSGASANW
jgi:hypothetical protein